MEQRSFRLALARGSESTAKRTVRACSGSSGRYGWDMANRREDSPPGSAVAVTNPDENGSPEAFHAFLDDLLAGPRTRTGELRRGEALRKLRVDAET